MIQHVRGVKEMRSSGQAHINSQEKSGAVHPPAKLASHTLRQSHGVVMRLRRMNFRSSAARVVCVASLSFILCSLLSGCLVAGYGTNTGGFIFPGGIGLLFVLGFILWFLLRRR
jgi:hypothetical protein